MTAKSLYVTAPSMETAEVIAKKLLAARLAACVNILPGARSLYYWEGQTVTETECVMTVKTTTDLAAAARDLIVNEHPYEEPCVLAFQIDANASAKGFLDWIESQTS